MYFKKYLYSRDGIAFNRSMRVLNRISRFRICKRWYRLWSEKNRIKTLEELKRQNLNNIIANKFAEKSIPRKCVRIWKEFVKSQKDQRWREFRKEMLRESVKV